MAVGNPTLQVAVACSDRDSCRSCSRQGANRQTSPYGSPRGNHHGSTGKPASNLSRPRCTGIAGGRSTRSRICRRPDPARGIPSGKGRRPTEGVNPACRGWPTDQARSTRHGIVFAIPQSGIIRNQQEAQATERPTPRPPSPRPESTPSATRGAVWTDLWSKPTPAGHRVGQIFGVQRRWQDRDP